MCCFLGKNKTICWCNLVKRKALAHVMVSILLVTCFVISVSAFYFDFQYFETDKLVYEVGETIDMVAKLIADFSDDGWCYVSFAVVTDLGPSFADEYFIPPSSLVRYLNSSYIIIPEHTSPSETGIQAFVLFTVEIYDTISQSAGNNIEITINRGHLTTIPLSPLSIQYGLNTSISLKFASVHNDNVVYSNETISIHIENLSTQTVLDLNTTSDSGGMINVNWSDSIGPPGLYNLTVSSDGNEDFLPFTDTLQITVLPALSNLTIISSPKSVSCQSPDGNHIEQAEIIVEHTDLESGPIDDSMVEWTASFGYGILTSLGNGRYSGIIPFNTSPGSYCLNISATNSQYQKAESTISVNVLANSLLFSTNKTYWNGTRGESVTVEFLIEQALNWEQPIQLQFLDEMMQFSLEAEVQSNISSSITIPIWHNISVGHHVINISSTTEYYQFTNLSQIHLIILGTLNANISTEISYYGELLEFNLIVIDDSNQIISLANISVFCDNVTIPFTTTYSTNLSTSQIVHLPLWISPGIHNIIFIISSQYYENLNYSISLIVWMRTNITIVITTGDTLVQQYYSNDTGFSKSINYVKNFVWFNHESSSNLVYRNHIHSPFHSSAYFSR